MIRLTTTGPESCGKTTLAHWLADRMHAARWLPEYAREFLSLRNGEYTSHDLVHFAEKLESDLQQASDAACLIADTDFYVLDIWWREKFPQLPNPMSSFISRHPFDLYLLCKPDLMWEPDALRENPHDRDRLFALYEQALIRDGRPYVMVSGEGEQRLQQAARAVEQRFPRLFAPP